MDIHKWFYLVVKYFSFYLFILFKTSNNSGLVCVKIVQQIHGVPFKILICRKIIQRPLSKVFLIKMGNFRDITLDITESDCDEHFV